MHLHLECSVDMQKGRYFGGIVAFHARGRLERRQMFPGIMQAADVVERSLSDNGSVRATEIGPFVVEYGIMDIFVCLAIHGFHPI